MEALYFFDTIAPCGCVFPAAATGWSQKNEAFSKTIFKNYWFRNRKRRILTYESDLSKEKLDDVARTNSTRY